MTRRVLPWLALVLLIAPPPNVIASDAWNRYKSCLVARPILTKSSTSAVIMTLSDAACQHLERSHMDLGGPGPAGIGKDAAIRPPEHTHDWRRSSHVAVTGFTFSGPISHLWYAVLERIVKFPNQTFPGMFWRLALDALVFSPVAVAGYFVWRTILEGRDVGEKLRARWRSGVVASLRFWPLANVVNFGFVPVELRVLYNNMLSLFWTGYLSHVNAKHLEKTK
mmetsp:Transcript_42337/g.83147  ORF Transcript_42337/g.83147 Transcript_42337/m.83147 type:complete len:223 (-) Transcript_42337:195-863(-)